MANIIYRKSKAGFDNCFEIEFAEKEVIPSAFYENGEYGAVLRFFMNMLRTKTKTAVISYGAGITPAVSVISLLP